MLNSALKNKLSGCEKDPLWRLENLYLIKTKKSKVSKLRLNRVQGILLDRIRNNVKTNSRVVDNVLKFRQGGVSTFFLLLHLDRTIFHPNTTTGILADLKENLGYLFEIVRFAHENMPEILKPKLGADSKTELTFPDIGSKIMVSLAIKSTTLHGLHVSEIAHMDQEDVERTKGACTPDAWITTETTAKGMNFYSKEWRAMKNSGEPCIFLPWPLQEEYKIDGKDLPALRLNDDENRLAAAMKRDYGIDMIDSQFRFRREKRREQKMLCAQEFAEDDQSCFLSSGGAFFDGRKVTKLIDEAKQSNPLESSADYSIWEYPQSRHIYVSGSDVAEGSAGVDPDFSTLCIICVTCRRTAFRYKARCGLDVFSRVCRSRGMQYNKALIAVEENNHGHAVILWLRENEYPNLYVRNKRTRLKSVNTDLKYGWKTDADTRPLMLDKLKLAVEGATDEDEDHFEPEIEWLDTDFLAELLHISEIDGKIQAASGEHDDLTFGWGIALQMYLVARPSIAGLDPKKWLLGDPMDSARDFKTE